MTFPRIPSPNQRYIDELGDTYEYTISYGWLAASKARTPTNSIQKKSRIKYNGSTRVRTTYKE